MHPFVIAPDLLCPSHQQTHCAAGSVACGNGRRGLVGTVMMGWWLDLMIVVVFSNLDDCTKWLPKHSGFRVFLGLLSCALCLGGYPSAAPWLCNVLGRAWMAHSGYSRKSPLASEKTQRCNFVCATSEGTEWSALVDSPVNAVSFRYSDSWQKTGFVLLATGHFYFIPTKFLPWTVPICDCESRRNELQLFSALSLRWKNTIYCVRN